MTQGALKRRRKWRRRSKLSLLLSLATISALIYWEQTAALYVLSTLAICVVLLLVAFADLEGKDKELQQPINEEVDHVDYSRNIPSRRRA